MDELEVRVAQPLHLAVVVEVLAIDVGHHRDDGREEEEGAVALVRLGDQELALPQARGARPDHGRRRQAARSTAAVSEVVVVFPWLPATATPYFMRISSAS